MVSNGEKEDRRAEAVLRATLESIEDGVLVISKSGRVSHCNTRFLEIWSIPPEILGTENDAVLLDCVMSQLADPAAFRRGVQEIYNSQDKTHDTVSFKDGRVVERFSSPLGFPGEEPERMWVFRDITARTRAEESLREREAQLSSILRAVPVGIVMVAERVLLEVNDGMCRISGYAREELIGECTRFLYPSEEEFQSVFAVYERLKNGAPTAGMECRWLRKDGTIIDIMLSAALLDARDYSLGATFAVIDITSRKRGEIVLREREAQLSSILRAAPVGIGVLIDRKFADVNEEITRLSGYGRDECIGRLARFLYPTESEYRSAGELYSSLLEGAPKAETETRWLRKDGAIIDIALSAASLDPGDPSRGATVAIVDVTEKKRAGEALLASQMLLSESQRAARIGSWELDVQTGRLTWTDECFRIYGFDPGEMSPCLDVLFSRLALPEDHQRIREHFDRAIATGTFEQPFEYRIRRKDGAVRWLNVTGTVKRDEAGVPVRFVGTQQDVTESKKNEEERLELERRLLHAQKLESLGILAGGIAHDFNNLLMAIMGNLDIAAMQLPAGMSVHSNLEQATRAAQRAADLTRQMLAYSGKANFTVGAIDLSALVAENAHLLRSGIPKIVSLDLRLAPKLPLIKGDAGQIQQVVMNLVTNAAEAIGDREGSIILSTDVAEYDAESLKSSRMDMIPPPGRFVRLEVSDTGCGMDVATQQRLFDPFFTTKFMGRGLGMSAILGIARGHNGAIFVESALQKGTTIRVLFPVESEARKSGEAKERITLRPMSEPPLRRAVLIVDDEEIVRTVCAQMVQKLGWPVLLAADGKEAIEILRDGAERIECVILDLSMPHMNGITVFREMRAVKGDLKVVLSSGFSGEQESVRVLTQEGLAGFIQKPYNFRSLTEELSRVLGGD